jgi:hypothetical protein
MTLRSDFREHVKECVVIRRETLTRIDEGFTRIRDERDRMHKENQEQFARLYGGLWKVALALIGALLANYLATHGIPHP